VRALPWTQRDSPIRSAGSAVTLNREGVAGSEPTGLAVSRLAEARERLAALRSKVAAILVDIRNGNIPEPDALERQLLAFRSHEAELVAEIAYLESAGGDDDGSAGALVPRHPRPLPMQGAGAAPIPPAELVLVSHLSEP
jgi:hypothetical protein